jgi:PPE-repeat protein
MLSAAAAWDAVADELRSTVATYQSVVSELTDEGWLGPASATMAAAAARYMTWMSATGAQAEQTAANASAAAGAFEAAFAMTVPPAEVTANRAQLMSLVATNFLGLNTAAIAATEAQYSEMWAQDAAAMYGYAGNSAVATVLKTFTQPPQIANPTGQLGQAAAAAQTSSTPAASSAESLLSQWISAISNALHSLSTPSGLWDFLDSNFSNGFISAGYTSPAVLQQTVTAAMADINAVGVSTTPGATALPPTGAGAGAETWTPILSAPGPVPSTAGAVQFGSAAMPSGWAEPGTVSAGVTRGALVGQLSVPSAWTEATQVANHAGTALPGGGWTGTAVPNGSGGTPGMPGLPAVGPGTTSHFGSGPRYGFRPTIMARPPAAG